jgi:hypothetical protein
MEGSMNRRRFVAAGALVAGLVPQHANAQDEDHQSCMYVGSLWAIVGMISWSMEELGTHTENSTAEDYVDEQFRVDVLAPFGIAPAAQHTLATLNPPVAFQEFHDLFAQAIEHFVIAGDYAEEAVLTIDESAMDLALEHTETSLALIDQAIATIPEDALNPG